MTGSLASSFNHPCSSHLGRPFTILFSTPLACHGCADLRLAVVSPFVDRRHGTERALAELLEGLARDHGCEIHLYSQRVEELALGPCSGPTGARGNIIWRKVPSIPGPHLFQFVSWLFLNQISRRRDRAIRGLHFDLVLSPGINCFDANVVLVHALFHRLWELARDGVNPFAMSGLFRRLHRRAYYSFLTWLESRIYRSSHVSLAAVSNRTASLLNRYFGRDDIRVIPNAVDASCFSPAQRVALRAGARAQYKFQESHFVLLFIGNDWCNKGLSTILKAMAALRDLPLCLLVAGQDAAAPLFFEAAGRLGLEERCRWETASTDAINLYAVADVYVSPTREDSFGLPLLEAMACGLPVITSVFAGASQIISHGVDGFVLSDPNDAATLAHHLEDLLKNPDFRFGVAENARRTAEAWSWERTTTATWQFLNEVASKKQA